MRKIDKVNTKLSSITKEDVNKFTLSQIKHIFDENNINHDHLKKLCDYRTLLIYVIYKEQDLIVSTTVPKIKYESNDYGKLSAIVSIFGASILAVFSLIWASLIIKAGADSYIEDGSNMGLLMIPLLFAAIVLHIFGGSIKTIFICYGYYKSGKNKGRAILYSLFFGLVIGGIMLFFAKEEPKIKNTKDGIDFLIDHINQE